VLAVTGDMHEHLGEMIAYARTNHIVPPWSKKVAWTPGNG
jgi:hypothetical protein